jgi:nucleotide-binding universal stress UspA family protein
MTREIGVGYDGSPESEHALSVPRTLAVAWAAKLSALEAVSLPSYASVGPGAADDPPQCLVEDALERIAALGGVEPHALMVLTRAAHAIERHEAVGQGR